MTVFCVAPIHFRSIVYCDDTLRLSHCKTVLFVINCYQCVKNFQLYIEILPILHVVKLYSSLIVISAAAAAASRCGLHQVTNDEVDGQGDRDDHVTEWWRHHRFVAQIRIAGTVVSRDSFIRLRSTTSIVVLRPSGTATCCGQLLWHNKNKKNLVVISFCEPKNTDARDSSWALPQLPLLVRSHSKFPERCRPSICSYLPIWSVLVGVCRSNSRKTAFSDPQSHAI